MYSLGVLGLCFLCFVLLVGLGGLSLCWECLWMSCFLWLFFGFGV